VGPAYYLCRVSNYSNSRVHGQGQLGGALKLRPAFPHKPSVCVCVVLKRCCYEGNNMTKFGDLAYRVNPDGLALINTLRL